MGMDDKIKANVDQAKGEVKETVGKTVGNEKLEAEGKKDKFFGKLKEAAEDVKDAVADKAEDVKDAIEDKMDDVKDRKK
jgi:uncharacterized protein YjbJ (UPF0337 family)